MATSPARMRVLLDHAATLHITALDDSEKFYCWMHSVEDLEVVVLFLHMQPRVRLRHACCATAVMAH